MKSFISAYDAKTKFGELLTRVSRGEEVVITRNGTPTARMIPEGQEKRSDLVESLQGIKARRSGRSINHNGLPKISLRELIDEGRK